MVWEPRAEVLNQILTLLKEYQTTDEEIQRKLEKLNHYPDFNNYLIYVLTKWTSQDEPTRSLSGEILMNNIKMHATTLQPTVIEYIKEECLMTLVDPSSLIRDTVGVIILAIIDHKDGLLNWPELLPTLCAMLDSQEYSICGALGTLKLICENYAKFLDSNELNQPLDKMVPKFLQFFRHTSPRIRSQASDCINQLFIHGAPPIMVHIDTFIDKLLYLLSDEVHEVKKNVCRGLMMLLDVRMDRLMPHMIRIIEYMLVRIQDQDETALEACKFWMSLAKQPICKTLLGPHFHKIIPVLVERMKYSHMVFGNLEENDQMILYRSAKGNIGNSYYEDEKSLVCDSIRWDWNLRKSSAAVLDILANVFKDETLPILLPILKETIFHEQWVIRESGILALGAVAEGCMQGMIPHLPELIPFLINYLSHEKALVRSITCWTLSRYANWIVSQPSEQYLKPLVEQLLKCILDEYKCVQKYACYAFETLEEEACSELVPYLGIIVKTLVIAFSKYQHKNLLILYDVTGTLAESIGHHLNVPEYIDMLVPQIIQKFYMLNVKDKDFLQLLECLSSVAIAMQSGFLPYFEHVYRRCISLIEQTLNQGLASTTSTRQFDSPDKAVLNIVLTLLSRLIESLGFKIYIGSLVTSSNIMQLLYQCMQDFIPEVRQSSFELLGDLTRACFPQVSSLIPIFLPILAQNLNPDNISVCNNAIWAIGEISIKLGAETKPFIPLVLGQLIEIINGPNTPKTLLENTVKAVGRLGFACPIEVAPSLKEFFRQWCSCMCKMPDDEEKDSAFRNMCKIIKVNPAGAVPDFAYFCDAAASLKSDESDLHEIIQSIFHGFKTQVGNGNWRNLVEQLPPQLAERLNGLYQI